MTTPAPIDIQVGLPWGAILIAGGALLAMLGFAIRMLHKGIHKRIDGTDITIKEKSQTVRELVVQLEERVGKYFEAHERLRDKWDEFLKEYLKIDSTRGQKVDALFRLNDQMQKILDTLPRHVDSKIEEAFTHSLSELKLYIRELMSREKPSA